MARSYSNTIKKKKRKDEMLTIKKIVVVILIVSWSLRREDSHHGITTSGYFVSEEANAVTICKTNAMSILEERKTQPSS